MKEFMEDNIINKKLNNQKIEEKYALSIFNK